MCLFLWYPSGKVLMQKPFIAMHFMLIPLHEAETRTANDTLLCILPKLARLAQQLWSESVRQAICLERRRVKCNASKLAKSLFKHMPGAARLVTCYLQTSAMQETHIVGGL